MKTQFPQTLEAAMGAEKSLWKIGDALRREAEEVIAGSHGLQAVATELASFMIEYSTRRLAELRATAVAFPHNRRHELSFRVHSEAGNPDTLDVIVKAARAGGQKVTSDYVRDALRSIYKQERAARDKAATAARHEAEQAATEEAAARKRELVAKDHEERDKAARERNRAAERKRKAKADEQSARSKVKPRKDREPPAEKDVPALVAITSLMANANEAERLAEKSAKLIDKHAADLSANYIAGLTDAAMTAANAWREVAAQVRKATSQKRGHLSVVGG